jgi:hypothetical protein
MGSNEFFISKVFIKKLKDRAQLIRSVIPIDEKKNLFKGRLFSSDEEVLNSVIALVTESTEPSKNKKPRGEAQGLSFEISHIESGSYDILIKYVLRELAALDFINEHSIDLM